MIRSGLCVLTEYHELLHLHLKRNRPLDIIVSERTKILCFGFAPSKVPFISFKVNITNLSFIGHFYLLTYYPVLFSLCKTVNLMSPLTVDERFSTHSLRFQYLCVLLPKFGTSHDLSSFNQHGTSECFMVTRNPLCLASAQSQLIDFFLSFPACLDCS